MSTTPIGPKIRKRAWAYCCIAWCNQSSKVTNLTRLPPNKTVRGSLLPILGRTDDWLRASTMCKDGNGEMKAVYLCVQHVKQAEGDVFELFPTEEDPLWKRVLAHISGERLDPSLRFHLDIVHSMARKLNRGHLTAHSLCEELPRAAAEPSARPIDDDDIPETPQRPSADAILAQRLSTPRQRQSPKETVQQM